MSIHHCTACADHGTNPADALAVDRGPSSARLVMVAGSDDMDHAEVILDNASLVALAEDLLTAHPTHTVTTYAALAATAERARKAEAAVETLRATLQRLHRPIESVEELRALPEHAVIVDDNGGAQQKTRGGSWLDYASHTGFCTSYDVDLPATLVWLLPTPAELTAAERVVDAVTAAGS